ncbi:2Fe-2S iron-sulfur cluster-binding protein [Streptomyces sp. TP-A0874]|uniref:2Fe-2S iron-sulfur cluster-binding protein n=1 Tax=Streptomyces sp. TP-A0874 TaxID=549819 RepID=UPI000853B6E5|nr:2Fe-2S iron-sulfur cluster-binding protein [Streptomyces sp. TP-A0874]
MTSGNQDRPRPTGWEPTSQSGEHDADATGFLQLPEHLLDPSAVPPGVDPLAAPGHGYVPPPISTATTDPGAPGGWAVPPTGSAQGQIPAQNQPHDGQHVPGPRGPLSMDGPERPAQRWPEPEPAAGDSGERPLPGDPGTQGPSTGGWPGQPEAGPNDRPGRWENPAEGEGRSPGSGAPSPTGGGADPTGSGRWDAPNAPAAGGQWGGLPTDGGWTYPAERMPAGEGRMPEGAWADPVVGGPWTSPADGANGTHETPHAAHPGSGAWPAPDAQVAGAGFDREAWPPAGGAEAVGEPGIGAQRPESHLPEPHLPEPHLSEARLAGPHPTDTDSEARLAETGPQEHPEPGRPEATGTAWQGGPADGAAVFTAPVEHPPYGEHPGPGEDALTAEHPESAEQEGPTGQQAPVEHPGLFENGTAAEGMPTTAPGGEAPVDAQAESGEPEGLRDPAADGQSAASDDGERAGTGDGREETAAGGVSEHPQASYVLNVNGVDRPVTDAWLGESLLYVLRERLGLAGAKDGCSQGECGACSVQVDGRLVASCLVPAATTAGSEVRTVEGLAHDGVPSDVQSALVEAGAVQCGFCVPGIAMTVHDLLEGNPSPSDLETRQAICGNLCRCSGYRGVLEAVRQVVRARADSTQPGNPAEAAEPRPDGTRIPQQPGSPGPGDAPPPGGHL